MDNNMLKCPECNKPMVVIIYTNDTKEENSGIVDNEGRAFIREVKYYQYKCFECSLIHYSKIKYNNHLQDWKEKD